MQTYLFYFFITANTIRLFVMNLILLILGRLYNINISSYAKTIQIMQYYYAINRASRRRPPRAVIVTPRTFRPCSLHAPRINTSHSTSQFTTSHFCTFALHSLHTPCKITLKSGPNPYPNPLLSKYPRLNLEIL